MEIKGTAVISLPKFIREKFGDESYGQWLDSLSPEARDIYTGNLYPSFWYPLREILAEHTKKHFKKLFGRSLQLRQVSAAGCNACEADLNVLATPFFDLARFGINFVASPRHADGIVVTGPVSRNMKTALLQTYEATPAPKVVIAVGSCTLSGGPFRGSAEITEGLDQLLPVDLYIPGCPPHPLTNLHALLTYFK